MNWLEQVPLNSDIVALILAEDSDTYVELVGQRSTNNSRGFSLGSPVSSHREC